MVGHGIGPANGAKVNGLVPADALFPVLGHHGSMTRIAVAAPIEMFPLQPNAKTRRGRVKHTQAFRHDFLSNAVARHYGNFMCLGHKYSPVCTVYSVYSQRFN